MKPIKSSIYTPNEVELARPLADRLNDEKSMAFYLSCAKKYPKDYLLFELNHVLSLPDHAIRTTRPRLFTKIITNSIYNIREIDYDDTWD